MSNQQTLVLCPTRNRPDNAVELYRSFKATKAYESTELIFILDADDPTFPDYDEKLGALNPRFDDVALLSCPPAGGMVKAVNDGLAVLKDEIRPQDVVGFVGDDNRFRTPGWDRQFQMWAWDKRVAVMYGHDKHRTDIPTSFFLTGNITAALGWIAMPDLQHLYVDNSWAELARYVGILQLFPQIIIEHLHPFFGTAPDDAGYARVNAPEMYERDRNAFTGWRNSPVFMEDVEKLRRLMDG